MSRRFLGPEAHTGRTLVEVMVSLVIAAVVLATVLLIVSGTGLTGRRQTALARLSDEGQVALSLVASQLRMAGFVRPVTAFTPMFMPPADCDDSGATVKQCPLKGCRHGFSDLSVSFDQLACAAGTGNDAIAIRYEADDANTVPSEGLPTDCLGQKISPLQTVADNRYFIRTNAQTGNPGLYCLGNGGPSAQLLVDSVQSMQLLYGVSDPDRQVYFPDLLYEGYQGMPVRYLDATEIETQQLWPFVTSVRVCLVMFTPAGVADEAQQVYQNCEGEYEGITPPDRVIRKALVTTVSLRNRAPVADLPLPAASAQ